MNKEIKNRQLSLWGKSKLKKHPSGNIYGEKESEMFIGAAFAATFQKYSRKPIPWLKSRKPPPIFNPKKNTNATK